VSSFGLVLRNLKRNRFRTMLTILGVGIAILAFVFLRTVLTAWQVGAENAAQDRLGTRHKLSWIIPLPKRYIDVVRAQDGVEAATYANWVGDRDLRNEDVFFAVMAVDPESYLQVYDEILITDAERDRWLGERRGALVGDVLARKLNLRVGGRITLTGTIYPGRREYIVAGIYRAARRSIDRSQFLIHWDFLNEQLPPERQDQIGWIVARVDEPSRVGAISTALDRGFEERDVPTLTMSERAMNVSFLGMASALLDAIEYISIIILAILLLLLGNTVAMGVRERRTELAVLRALGFRRWQVVLMIVTEGMGLGLFSGLLGLALSFPLVELMFGRFVEENFGGFIPYFRIAPATYALAAGLALLLGAVAATIPAWGTWRMSVTDALRKVA
jgi:putative ABC transport system permease protein